jgi:hypothetical protein
MGIAQPDPSSRAKNLAEGFGTVATRFSAPF